MVFEELKQRLVAKKTKIITERSVMVGRSSGENKLFQTGVDRSRECGEER